MSTASTKVTPVTSDNAYRIRGMADRIGGTEEEQAALGYIGDAVLAYAHEGDRVRNMANSLIERCARALRSLDAGQHVNSLGEVQGGGFDVDRACALREQAATNVIRAAAAMLRLGVVSEEQVARLLAGTEFAREAPTAYRP